MANKINYLDEFAEWILHLGHKNGQWHAVFYPGTTVIRNSIESVIHELLMHVMYETIELGCDALNTTVDTIRADARSVRNIKDNRLAIANVLLTRFNGKINYGIMGRALGWTSHCMMIHARKVADVREIALKIDKIYSRYPFLKDNYKSLRT